MEYPDLESAILAHAEALKIPVEASRNALINRGLVESALARPRNAAAYEEADIVRQAATLFYGVASSHGFRDGNKRTALVLLRAFFDVNGYALRLSEDERFSLAVRVAEGRASVTVVEAALRPGVRARRTSRLARGASRPRRRR